MSKPTIMITWDASSYHGWGIYGLNLILNWAGRSDFNLCCLRSINPAHLGLNALEVFVIEQILANSEEAQARLKGATGDVTLSCIVLHALGNNLMPATDPAQPFRVSGMPNIGIAFFETTAFDEMLQSRANRYPLIVVGSSWNKSVLASAGINHARVVLQGVDPTHFHPAPKMGRLASRFVIFSGGKLERRKGQDLVVQAFRAFSQRHKDALLITAWSSPFARLARTLSSNSAIRPVPFNSEGQVDTLAWTNANGIASRQVLHFGQVPNSQMPRIVREADVALFPNRAEGGTNLVAMECMACGVPTILSANTGHLDLIDNTNCYALERQRPILDRGCDGWGESDVDEIVELLESVYQNRDEAQARGQRGAMTMSKLSWARQLDELSNVIMSFTN